MLGTYVEDRVTPLPFDVLLRVTREVLPLYAGSVSEEVVALVVAKQALETARGQKVHGFNLGNQKHSPTMDGMWSAFACNEILVRRGSRSVVWFSPAGELGYKTGPVVGKVYSGPPADDWHPQTRFSVFANEYDGAYNYFDLLFGSKRYARSRAALLTGNATSFVAALKLDGYMTADEKPYRDAVASLQREFLARMRANPIVEAAVDNDHLFDIALDQVTMLALEAVRADFEGEVLAA